MALKANLVGSPTMIDIMAVIPVRGGMLPVGANETVAQAQGRCWVVGSGVHSAVEELTGLTGPVYLAELGSFSPGRWAAWLTSRLPADQAILLPQCPDGRDLAPRLAAARGWPLVSGVMTFEAGTASVARHGGLAMDTIVVDQPMVATLQIGGHAGSSKVEATQGWRPEGQRIDVEVSQADLDAAPIPDALVVRELPADRATMDLAEAPRIVAAGAGLGDRSHIAALEAVAERLGASVGATRVVTDWGWMPADRQIGTTGVMVRSEEHTSELQSQ